MQVILHNIRSCYNVGSIFRTADVLGVEKIYLGGYTPNPKKDNRILKTSLGAEKFVDWEVFWQTHRKIEELKKAGSLIVALEQAEKSQGLSEVKFGDLSKIVLLLGNERKGLSQTMLKKVDQIIEIPMQGKKESLNVSVAFGIAGYTLINNQK